MQIPSVPIVLLFAIILASTCGSVSAQVHVWQGTLTLPTYEEGPPDPNPPFDTYATTEFNYPYTMRTNLTETRKAHAWRALFLENEYLKCTILPDIGGHLYTCMDKLSGQSMFYDNTSIKKAEIGHRGAWAALGVEFNFPVSHNWVSLSPVDFADAIHADGSASVTIGNIDRAYGMQWNVELTLRPGSTLLEEHVTLYNRSDVRHRFYWWDNAGVRVWDDSHLQYPMRYVASHGFTDVYEWPVLMPGGKDLSIVGNETDGPVSYFAHGTRETFMGVWNPRTNTGTAQFSEYQDLPAKKVWSWGSDPAGLQWREALSDDHSSYVEIQAGLFRNQETYSFLDPGQTIQFSEVWMPVRGTGGISRANPAGVLYLGTKGAQVQAVLNVNRRIQGAHLSLTQGDKTLWSSTLTLSPKKTWTESVPATSQNGAVTFELKDREGKSLLKQTEGEYDLDPASLIKTGPQQKFLPAPPAKRSEDEWLQVGGDQELQGQALLAMTTYKNGLEAYPDSLSLKIAAGRLAASLQRYQEAEPLLREAQQLDTPNSVVAYYLGIAEEGLGHEREAETAFDIAYRQASYRAAAAVKLAGLHARAGQLERAWQLAKTATVAEPLNLEAREKLAALTRGTGDGARADQIARAALETEPTSDFLKNELGTPDLPHFAADPYRMLRIATEYMDLGLYRKALELLDRKYPAVDADQTEPGSVLPQLHPMVRYYAAYCRSKLDLNAGPDWREASELNAALVFPSTEMDHVVLEAAIQANPLDATAQYLLGTLLFSKGLYDEGISHWTEAQRINPELPVVDADLGRAWLDLKDDPQQALTYFHPGLQNDRLNPEVYAGLDEAMSLTHAAATEREAALSRYPDADSPHSTMPSNLTYELALTRAEAGDFQKAEALFQGRFFASEEGGITSDEVLFEVELMDAEGMAQSGKCAGAYASLAGDLARLTKNGASSQGYFRMAKVAKNCGQPQLATTLLQKATHVRRFADTLWAYKALQSLGSGDAPAAFEKIQQSLTGAGDLSDRSLYGSYHWYGIGLLQSALNQRGQATHSFENALILPDEWMAHHLARVALEQLMSDPTQVQP
jgi:tetratricopeptide (TPR) repeat protein